VKVVVRRENQSREAFLGTSTKKGATVWETEAHDSKEGGGHAAVSTKFFGGKKGGSGNGYAEKQ